MRFLLANVLTLAIHGVDKTAARKTRAECRIHFVGVWAVGGGLVRLLVNNLPS